MSFFITGTDTGVGKTHMIVQLLRLLRVSGRSCVGFKPICCGDRRDAEELFAAGTEGFAIDQINPVWLKTPLAPFPAAQLEGATIDLEKLRAAFSFLRSRVDVVLVEGVGGWRVPIHPDYFVSDLARALGLPVLVVAMNRLGCLNHTLLTVESVHHCGLVCAAVVLNTVPGSVDIATATNSEILDQLAGVPILPPLTGNMAELPSIWRRTLATSAV